MWKTTKNQLIKNEAMKKFIVSVFVVFCSLSAFSQIKISISEISLKKTGAETFEYYDEVFITNIQTSYIKIEADVFNDSSEPFDIETLRSNDIFRIEYKYNDVPHISRCKIQNPIPGMDGVLSIPPKSSLKLFLVTTHYGLHSEDYISNFIEVFPTITVKFTDDEMNKLIETSEPIEFHSLSVKSAMPE